MSFKKTAVLVHGFHLQAEQWHRVVWGDTDKQLLGRLPKAVLVASEQAASMIVLGTGASQKDGMLEADYTKQFLLQHLSELQHFEALRNNATVQEYIAANLPQKLLTETTSQNTVSELRAIGRLLIENDVQRLYLISSPTHASRCLRDAIVVFTEERDAATTSQQDKQRWQALLQNLYVSPSDTSYAGTDASMVQILEPKHRPPPPQM